MLLIGTAIPFVQTGVTTMLQEKVPLDKQGRLFGLRGAMYTGFMPLGMALFGPLADQFVIQHMVILCGFLLLMLGAALCMMKRYLGVGMPEWKA